MYLTFRQTVRRHFRVVHDGRLYRSGAMNFAEFRRFVEEYGIKTVINLRDVSGPNDPYPDPEEEEYCRDRGIADTNSTRYFFFCSLLFFPNVFASFIIS